MSNITKVTTPILCGLASEMPLFGNLIPTEIRVRNNASRAEYIDKNTSWLTATFHLASRRETAITIRNEIQKSFGDAGAAAFNKQFKGIIWGFKPITDVALANFVKSQNARKTDSITRKNEPPASTSIFNWPKTDPTILKNKALTAVAETLKGNNHFRTFQLSALCYNNINRLERGKSLSPQEQEELRIYKLLHNLSIAAWRLSARYVKHPALTATAEEIDNLSSTTDREKLEIGIKNLLTRAEKVEEKHASMTHSKNSLLQSLDRIVPNDGEDYYWVSLTLAPENAHVENEDPLKKIGEHFDLIRKELEPLEDHDKPPGSLENQRARKTLVGLYAAVIKDPEKRASFETKMNALSSTVSNADFIECLRLTVP